MVRVFRDGAGLFIRHGDDKVRPIAPPTNPLRYEGYRREVERTRGVIIQTDGASSFLDGDRVNKHHIPGTILVYLTSTDGRTEVWFIQESHEVMTPLSGSGLNVITRLKRPGGL